MPKIDNPFYERGKPPRPDKIRAVDFRDELERAWGGINWGHGTQTELGKIKICLVSKPTENESTPEIAKDPIHYLLPEGPPHLELMKKQHAKMVQALKDEGVKIEYFDVPEVAMGAYGRLKNCVPTREALMLHGGVIIPRVGLAEWRRGYEMLMAKKFAAMGCPILHTCKSVYDGGGHIWLDHEHLICTTGPGTSIEGINELRPLFEWAGVKELHVGHCLGWVEKLEWPKGNWMWHLDVAFGMVDAWLALIYPAAVDYDTILYLKNKGIRMIEVQPEEARNFACNTVAIEPGKIIMVSGNPLAAKALRKEGVDVIEVEMSEPIKGGFGPHCDTLPLVREPGPRLESKN